jgi:peptide/nickel transport system substrate-binding protein
MVIVSAALLVSGCGGGGGGGGGDSTGGSAAEPAKGGSMEVAQAAEVITLDPLKAIDGASITVLSQIMEPLYKTSPDDELVPWLVSSGKESADGLTWTFELKKGVKFSDGKPLTAEDVVFSLDEARESVNAEALFEAIKDVKATSPTTVVVTMKEPSAALLANLSSFNASIVPKDFGGLSEAEFGQSPVGTGPFKLGPWKRGQSLTLERNTNYWDPERPFLDKVVVRGVPDENSRLSQLRGGQADVIQAPAYSQIEGLESTPGLVVGQYAMGKADMLDLNSTVPLFKSAKVREAIDLAIDRESIVSAALSGVGETAGSWLSPPVLYHNAGVEAPEQDVAKAKELLAEAVKEEGVDPSFTLQATAGETYPTTASQIIQQDLEEAGFEVKLQPLDSSALIAQLSGGDHEASLVPLYPSLLDPSNLTAFYLATEGLFTKADISKETKLAEEGLLESDPEKRRQAYYALQQAVADQRYLITLDYSPYVWAMQDDVVGFASNGNDLPWFADMGRSE